MGSYGNTALGYQMMIENFILHCMTSASTTGNFYIASAYAKAYSIFLGVEANDFPDEPALVKSRNEFMTLWEQYYFKMLTVIFTRVHKNLAEVRAKYKPNPDIPTMSKSSQVVN